MLSSSHQSDYHIPDSDSRLTQVRYESFPQDKGFTLYRPFPLLPTQSIIPVCETKQKALFETKNRIALYWRSVMRRWLCLRENNLFTPISSKNHDVSCQPIGLHVRLYKMDSWYDFVTLSFRVNIVKKTWMTLNSHFELCFKKNVFGAHYKNLN